MIATSILVQVKCIMTSASNFLTISSQIEKVASAVDPPAPYMSYICKYSHQLDTKNAKPLHNDQNEYERG